MTLFPNVIDEVSPLEQVILGTAQDKAAPKGINPKAKRHIENGTFPTERQLQAEMDNVERVLENLGVQVYRPKNIPTTDQMYVRDIAFVIGQKLVKASMRRRDPKEYEGIREMVGQISQENLIVPPEGAYIEGGDIILHPGYIFVGQSDRTNAEGLNFLIKSFPEKEVIPIYLQVNDDPERNVLHLDCAFQPVGQKWAIVWEEGFKGNLGAIYDIFGENNLIKISSREKYSMFTNIFSITPEMVISERKFERLNDELRNRGIQVSEVTYSENAKLDGLLRCSTMPLRRGQTKN